jgi:hypothetical protein
MDLNDQNPSPNCPMLGNVEEMTSMTKHRMQGGDVTGGEAYMVGSDQDGAQVMGGEA